MRVKRLAILPMLLIGCFLMKAGTASSITEFDAWMFRDWWRHLKSCYGR
ncbi:hypothetical protein ABGB18_25265 [Nonomuraea sp. B12E4]